MTLGDCGVGEVGEVCGVADSEGVRVEGGAGWDLGGSRTWSFAAEGIGPFDMATLPVGVPSTCSGWLVALRVMRRAEPGGMEIFMSDNVNSAGEVEVLGRLTKIVFLPEELDP